MVDYAEYFFVFVEFYFNLEVPELSLELPVGGEGAQFLRSIDGVCHQFAEENLMIGIKELFDYRKYVLGGYTDGSLQFFFCHNKKSFQLLHRNDSQNWGQ